MQEHKYIYLQPECCANEEIGRLWCEHPDPEDCENGSRWAKYILFEEHEKLTEDAKILTKTLLVKLGDMYE